MRDIVASQSGHEVISLQKEDSLLVLVNAREAKKISCDVSWRDFDKNLFESDNQISYPFLSLVNKSIPHAEVIDPDSQSFCKKCPP